MRRLVFFVLALAAGTPAAWAGPAEAIRFLERRVQGDPADFVAWNQLAGRYLALLRDGEGEPRLTQAEKAAAASLKAMAAEQNACGLAARAGVEMAGHLFLDALASATQLQALQPGEAAPWQLIGDARLGLGDYAEAGRAFDQLAEVGVSLVAIEPRLARLELVHGRPEAARMHFENLQKVIEGGPAELHAWVLVQLGELAFRQGDWDGAERQYTAALTARPDDIAAQEHLAELRGATGRLEEAAALYRAVINRTGRPEFSQALGDLYAFMGDAAQAEPWHRRAETAYLASIQNGRVLYLHHLAGFYADSQPDPAQALAWAQRDMEQRHSLEAWDALAWAQYRNGQFAEAATSVARALASGTADAHVLYHAGLIRMSVGDVASGKATLRQALSANPRHTAFHVHR